MGKYTGVVFGVVGAVIGGYFGGLQGAEAGYAIGSLVGGALTPNTKVSQSKLADLKAPQASYGSPIPYVQGAPRLAGCVIWCSDKRAVSHVDSEGGKGGPGVDSTTYTYEIDICYEVAINRCTAVRRIWSNGALVWSNADDADSQTLAASGGIFVDIANNLFHGGTNPSWRALRFYNGAPDQLPDPAYESLVGVGNAPAFRSRTTIVIEGLNLGGSGQLPVLTFEVVSEASAADDARLFGSVPADRYYISGIPAMQLQGFDMLVGSFNGAYIDSLTSYRMSTDGSATPTATFDISGVSPSTQANSGNSDVSIFVGDNNTGNLIMFELDGSVHVIACAAVPLTPRNSQIARRGDYIVVPDNATGVVGLFDSGGFYQNQTTLPKPVKSVDIGGGFVYGLAGDETCIYQIDLSTFTLVATITFPTAMATPANAFIVCNDSGGLYLTGEITSNPGLGGTLWSYDGSAWKLEMQHIDAVTGTAGQTSFCLGFSGGVLMSQQWRGPPVNATQIHFATSLISATPPTLDVVLSRLCLRTGQLNASDIDVTASALATTPVRGFAVSQVSTTRDTIDSIMAAYLVTIAEGTKIRFVPRGGAQALTIPYIDLGVSSDGAAEPLPRKRLEDVEVAAVVTITYANTLNDFQNGSESGDRLVTDSTAVNVVELPFGFQPTEAKRLADANTMDLAVSMTQIGPASVGRKYSALEPSDVIGVVDSNGDTFRVRIDKLTTSGGVLTMELVLDDATAIASVASTDTDYSSSSLVRAVSDTVFAPLDIPLLRDVDNSPGFYAEFNGGTIWPGAELDKSTDGTAFVKVLDATTRGNFGRALTVLSSFTRGNVIDSRNTVTVDVGDGTLSSASRDVILSSQTNALSIGSEVIQFITANLVSPGVYILSGLLRGLRGTEENTTSHVVGERVAVLALTTLRNVPDQASDLNVTYTWRATSFGKSPATAATQKFADTGIRLKPFAVRDIRLGTNNSAQVFTWHRRDRLASRFLMTTPYPLGEVAESYDVELRDASNNLRQAATVFAPTFTVSGLIADPTAYVSNGLSPIFGMKIISGERVTAFNSGGGAFSSAMGLARYGATGTLAVKGNETPGGDTGIANYLAQWCNNGDSLYAVTADFYPGFGRYLNSKLQKFTRGTIGTLDAVVSDTTNPGDWQGVAHDGTHVWIALQNSNKLRKLDATTLATITDYAVPGGPSGLWWDATSSKLFVCCFVSGELVRWDIGSNTEDWRVSCPAVADVLVANSLAFTVGAQVRVFNAATGAAVITHPYVPISPAPQRSMALFGSNVAFVLNSKVLVVSASTGALVNLLSSPTPYLYAGIGYDGTDLWLTVSDDGASIFERPYLVAPPGLTGYSLTVYQNSATVGRGYPSTLQL